MLSARSQVCGGLCSSLECLADADNGVRGSGWALAIPIMGPGGYWVGGGVVPTQYHPPACTGYTAPGPASGPASGPACPSYRSPGHQEHAHMTVLRLSKDILGVNNAHQYAQ